MDISAYATLLSVSDLTLAVSKHWWQCSGLKGLGRANIMNVPNVCDLEGAKFKTMDEK